MEMEIEMEMEIVIAKGKYLGRFQHRSKPVDIHSMPVHIEKEVVCQRSSAVLSFDNSRRSKSNQSKSIDNHLSVLIASKTSKL